MKIGIYPGSYNPVHTGHMFIVKKLLQEHIVDKIILIPLNSYWDKTVDVSLNDRIALLKQYEDENIIIDGACSDFYAYQIINKYKEIYKEDTLYYIIGSDNLENIDKWKNIEDVLKNKFIVVERVGYDSLTLMKEKGLNQENFTITRILDYPISSTEIRRRLKNNEDTEHMLDRNVLDYIKNNKLYGSEENV